MADRDFRTRAPLFDRLVDEDVHVLDRRGLRESVRRELEHLLNTRTSLTADQLDERERTVIEYGIPDFAHLSPQNEEDQARLADSLTRAIAAYEPRLSGVRVVADTFVDETRSLRVRIDAALVVDRVSEPVSFESILPAHGHGRSEVILDD